MPGTAALAVGAAERRVVPAALIAVTAVVADVGSAGERRAAIDVDGAAPVPVAPGTSVSVSVATSTDVAGAELVAGADLVATAVATVVSTVTVTAGSAEPEQPTRTVNAAVQAIAQSDRRSARVDRPSDPRVNA